MSVPLTHLYTTEINSYFNTKTVAQLGQQF